MSRWKTSFENLRLNQSLQESLALLEGMKTEGMADAVLGEYSRLFKVLKVLSNRFSKLDPELSGQVNWPNISNSLANAQAHIRSFAQNPANVGLAQNANNHIDNILNLTGPLDAAAAAEEFKSIAQANAEFQQKLIGELKRVDALSQAIAQAKTRLDQTDQTINQQKERLDKSIAEYQKQFSEAQEKRAREFADAAKRYADEISVQRQAFDAAFSQTTAGRTKEYEQVLEDTRKRNQEHLEFLRSRHEQVNDIFGAIGSTAFAGNFKTTADNEGKAANLWRWIAFGLMATMIGVAGFAFYWSIAHQTEWHAFAFRLGTVIVLAVPAAYAGNESSKHRERERLNRKAHLELASIDAYLVLLPETERNKIKATLAEKFFGVPLVADKTSEVTQKDFFGLVSTVVNNLTKGK